MRAIIIAAGHAPDDQIWQKWLRAGDLIIGADGGGAQALAWGVVPSVVIGDMDSISDVDLSRLRAKDCQFIEHPRAKDETDLELALTYAAQAGVDEIVILGAWGGRLDHTLCNVLLLNHPSLEGIATRIVHGAQEVQVVHGGQIAKVEGRIGDLVSLIPLNGDAKGVTTFGLAWTLADEPLIFGFSRGVSNEMTDPTAQIEVKEGTLLVVHGPPDRG